MLIVGFPTHGLVGSIVASYLVETLSMGLVAQVESEGLPPTVVMQDGVVASPIRIYGSGMVCGPEKKCSQLLVAISDIQPEAPLLNRLGQALVDWAEAKGVEVVFVVEGKPVEGSEATGDVHVVALANVAGVPTLKSCGFPRASGMLTGFGAAVLRAGIGSKLPIVCLVSEAHRDHPDGRAAAKVIESVRPLVSQLPLDPEPLRQRAETLEVEQRKTLKSHRANVQKLTESPTGEMFR